jgi:hypothetical protein
VTLDELYVQVWRYKVGSGSKEHDLVFHEQVRLRIAHRPTNTSHAGPAIIQITCPAFEYSTMCCHRTTHSMWALVASEATRCS